MGIHSYGFAREGNRFCGLKKLQARRLSLFFGTLLATAALLSAGASSASALPANFFGFQFSGGYAQSPSDVKEMAKAGAKYLRINLNWGQKVQADNKGEDGWQPFDEAFQYAWENGITIIPDLYGNLSGTGTRPSEAEWSPKGSGWETWLYQVVQKYGYGGSFWAGKANPLPVGVWEIWNEPNRGANGPDGVNTKPQEYGRFLKRSAEALRNAQGVTPITVLMGGLLTLATGAQEESGVWRWNESVHDFLKEVSSVSGVGEAFNGLSLHPYAFGENPSTVAASVENNISVARTNLNESFSSSKGIWITELGWPVKPWGDPTHLGMSEQGQSELLGLTFTWIKEQQAAKNIQSLLYYMYRDVPGWEVWDGHTGLREGDGTFRTAWCTYSNLTGAYLPCPPVVKSTGASNVQPTQATLNGTINPRWKATSYYFEYGTTSAYDVTVPIPSASMAAEAETKPVSLTITGVQPGTSYHYRIVASNADGTAYSEDRTFTIPGSRFARGLSNGSSISSWSTMLSSGLPPELVTGDFNGDGKVDIINLEHENGTFYRYRVGTSTGTGISSWSTVLGGKDMPERLAGGDFNGDGKTDIVNVESEGGGKYRYQVGISNGTGISSWNTVLSGMGLPTRLEVGDFTGDGKADIIAVESEGGSSGPYRYMLGTSNGTGISSWKQLLGGMSYPLKTNVGDFTGDGKADIVSVEDAGGSSFRYMLGTSNGSTVSSWNQLLGGMSFPYKTDLGDFNKDGKADIVSAEIESGTSSFRYMLGTSNGGGIASWKSVLGGKSLPRKMTVGDFSGDGKGDIIGIETEGGGARQYRLGLSTGTGVASWESVQTWMAKPTQAGVGDFNADGKADIISLEPEGNEKYRYKVGFNTGAPGITTWKPLMNGMSYALEMAVGDFNNDGKADIVSAEPESAFLPEFIKNKCRYALGISNGAGIASWTVLASERKCPKAMDVGDFTGDGKADIVSVEYEKGELYGGTHGYTLGTSTGTGISSWKSVLTEMKNPEEMAVDDFNGDGKADIIAVESEGVPFGPDRYMRGLSTGTGVSGWTSILTGMEEPKGMDLGDVNNDGKADIVSVELENGPLFGPYRYKFGISNGTGVSSWNTALGGMSNGPSFLSTGDIDGDGKDDVVGQEGY